MDPRVISIFKALGQDRTFARGHYLFTEGDAAERLCLVDAGRVRLSIVHDEGRELTLAIYGPGEVFGEADVILCRPRSCQAQVMRHGTRVYFLDWQRSHPEAVLQTLFPALLHLMAERTVARDRRLVSIAFEMTILRVVRALNILAAQECGVVTATHQQIADVAGCSRECTTRAIGHLAHLGLINRQGAHRLLVSPPVEIGRARRMLREAGLIGRVAGQ